MYTIGVDLGGTNTAAAVFDERRRLLGRASVPTVRDRSPAGVAESIACACRESLKACGADLSQVRCIGIGSPGIIDPEQGVIEYWSRYDFTGVAMADLVGSRLKKPVYMENDANAAALGEYVAGAGAGQPRYGGRYAGHRDRRRRGNRRKTVFWLQPCRAGARAYEHCL